MAGGREGKERVIVKLEVISGRLDAIGPPLSYLNAAYKQLASLNVLLDSILCYELIRMENKMKK